jgi:hypothetical protein
MDDLLNGPFGVVSDDKDKKPQLPGRTHIIALAYNSVTAAAAAACLDERP